jgi:hypothetical protein
MNPFDSGQERVISLYGTVVRSRFPFANRMIASDQAPRLEFVASPEPPDVQDWAGAPAVFESFDHLQDGRPRLSVVQADGFQVVRIAGLSDYYLWDDRIWCHLIDAEGPYTIEIHLLGIVMCYWLEQRGLRVLHASAVTLDAGAVGFIAGNKSGKSSIAAAFLERGVPLLTDDFLALDCRQNPVIGHPGYPQMRMWPDQARHFMGTEEGLPLVHPALSKRRVPVGGDTGLGVFHPEPAPVTHLYLPERAEDGVAVTPHLVPLSPRDAVIELITRSFLGPMLGGIGLEAARFESFVRLARTVPIRRLVYPHGADLLPQVLDTILADVAGNPNPSPAS